jgi:hypothetical protein
MGCDTAQGFYISRPQSALDLLKWHIESPWGQALYRHGEEPPVPIVGEATPEPKTVGNGPKSIH